MPISVFIKKHKEDVVRVVAGIVLCASVAVFILAFQRGALPYSADGDAFDTVYALDSAEEQSNNILY